MDRQFILDMWDASHEKYTWIPPFIASFKDLTPQQAAWKPDPKRHSIWQNLHHISFWREATIRRLKGENVSDEEKDKNNFAEPAQINADTWGAAIARFEKSNQLIHDAILNEKIKLDDLKYILPHDAYHMGQVMCLRALQGIPPVSYE